MTPDPDGVPRVLGRATGPHGEVVLRERPVPSGEPVVELVVDGVFAMDTTETSTEARLATAALERCDGDRLRVLVGGLGLGFTAAALLDDARVAAVEVVELHEELLRWAARGLLPGLRRGGEALADRRLRLRAGDVLDALTSPASADGGWDAVLLDVDNGPDFLVHPRNAAVYAPDGLQRAVGALRPGGVLAVWSSHPAPQLVQRLESLPRTDDVEQLLLPVERDGRALDYAVVLARHSS